MKATILAIAITFASSGVVATEADAQSRRRSYNKTRSPRSHVRTPRKARRSARTYRSSTRRTARQPARRHYRKPARQTYRQTTRRHVRRPARRNYRKPARRNYRRPARRNYRRAYRPVRRNYRPVYRSAANTVALGNSQHFGMQVVVRAGHSSVCSANPVQSNQYLAPGSSVTVTTYGSYVCYRQLSTRFTSGTGWYRAVLSTPYTSLSF